MRGVILLVALTVAAAPAWASPQLLFLAAMKYVAPPVEVTTGFENEFNDSNGSPWNILGGVALEPVYPHTGSNSLGMHIVTEEDFEIGGFWWGTAGIYHNYILAEGNLSFYYNASPGATVRVYITPQSATEPSSEYLVAAIPGASWFQVTVPISGGNIGAKRVWIVNHVPDDTGTSEGGETLLCYIDDISVPVP